jgi:hypothetical protein
MAMQSDVKSVHTTGNGQVISLRTRIKGFVILGSGAAGGDVVLYDTTSGSATGNELLRFALPNNSNNVVTFTMPDQGILAKNGVYITVPSGASITIIYA